MRETKVAMPTLALHSQQLRIKQLGKVRADSLLRYTRHLREFSCGKRLAGHQGRENLGPSVVSDKRGDANDIWPILHGSILVEPLRRDKGVPFNRESHGERQHDHRMFHPVRD